MQNTNPNVNIGFLPDFQDFRKKQKTKKQKQKISFTWNSADRNHPSTLEKGMVLKIEYIHFELGI